MEKAKWEKQLINCQETLPMLEKIAEQCQAQQEKEICMELAEHLEELKKEPVQNNQENDLFICMNYRNRIAANLLMNQLEPWLITVVMNGEEMAEKMKLLNPRLGSTKKRLEEQVQQESQKLERMVVKCVMQYEAGYHIMIRKIREDLMEFADEGIPVNFEQELDRSIVRHAYGCLAQIEADVEELEQEIAVFSEELSKIKTKCRTDTIEIMNNEFFNIIAQKTEQALDMIHYTPQIGALRQIHHKMEQSTKNRAGADKKIWSEDTFAQEVFGMLPPFSVEEELLSWQESGETDAKDLLREIGKKANRVLLRGVGKAKMNYNVFLKQTIDAVMAELRAEATGYLEALQSRLGEAVRKRRNQTTVNREELAGLLEMRNRIARTLEENQKEMEQ